MSTAHLLGQLVLSLAAVLALMWVASKLLRRAGGVRTATTLEVVARKQLSRTASVSVVRIGERALVLGVTETTVSLLAEAALEDFAVEESESGSERAESPRTLSRRTRTPLSSVGGSGLPVAGSTALPQARGPLAGSILSPATWKQSVDVLRERTARRG